MGLMLREGFYISLIFLFTAFQVMGSQPSGSVNRMWFSVPDTLHLQPDSLLAENLLPDTLQAEPLLLPFDLNSGVATNDSVKASNTRPTFVPSPPKPVDTVKYWKTGGCITLNISQIALSNWSAGGQNSVAANALLTLTANYSKKSVAWDNTLDYGFGRIKREDTKAVKTDDRLEFLTKYGHRFAKKWYYSALLNFKTQVFPGYDYPEKDSVKKSDFLSPATVFLSVGIDYKPNSNFSFLLSTITGKTTVVKSEYLSSREFFGVDSGKHFRHEFGGYMKLLAKGTVFKFVNYQFKLDAFSNYMVKPENVDFDCELLLTAKLNKYITATFKTNFLYDDDVVTPPKSGPRLQRRQFLGLGFSYRF